MEQALQENLIDALGNPVVWSLQAAAVEVIETHISVIFLVGDFAYKLKKAVDLGFLDFSTLEKRRLFCQEEIRLNKRLAPDVYVQAVPVCGELDSLQIDGQGEAIEWLVKMRRFDAHAVLSDQPDLLDADLISTLAGDIAQFHLQAEPLNPESSFGTPQAVLYPMQENFDQIRNFTTEESLLNKLVPIERWTNKQFQRLHLLLQQRRRQGFIRECHGDLHLGNIVVEDGRPLIFDGIEFSPGLRWLDTLNDLAFLLMDLHYQGRSDLIGLLLNRYLDVTGDYSGLPLISFYLVYRAMVRAKVAAIRLAQPHLQQDEIERVHEECLSYLELAERFTHPGYGAVMITHGLSGSGKSTLTESLLPLLPVVRLRSDVERKRLAGLDVLHRSEDPSQLYNADMTTRTYLHLKEMAAYVVESGHIALIDATCLKAWQRRHFSRLAVGINVPFLILDFDVSEEELRGRIEARMASGEDVSDAGPDVLSRQIKERDPLREAEQIVALSAQAPVMELAESTLSAVYQR